MTEEERVKCHAVIHSTAISAGAGNCVPVPGLGVAVDMTAMVVMTMSLSSILGLDIQKEVAKALVIATLKETALKQPIKIITKELAKLIPFAGQVVSSTISVTMVEATGWSIVNELERKYRKQGAYVCMAKNGIAVK